VVRHQRRHDEIRQPDRARGGEPVEAVVAHRRLDRAVIVAAPLRQQPVEPDRIDHRTGEDMGADLGSLLHHHDGDIRRALLEADGRRQSGRAGTDDHHVEFHRFARWNFVLRHDPSPP
jgi:hypothetical protein